MNESSAVLQRFLNPRFAAINLDSVRWQSSGQAVTPGSDAECRILLTRQDNARLAAAFTAYGPPVTIAVADWLCESVDGETVAHARQLAAADLEDALSLPATERHAALMVVEALAKALSNLGS